MSYVVLARKWRPQRFEEVVGQKHVVITLQNAITSKRLANAYLFCGPRGVGKTTVARILAKAINCEQGPTVNPCNECTSCTEIAASRSLDVFEIDGASNRGIDEVRNLRENLKYAASPGKYKIYIIDEVHMLTDPAFNALLKTLEEPPERVLFIFATTEPHKIPATILSRCQRFDFKRITTAEIINQLSHICKQEEIEIDDEALHMIAHKADGGMRDAQSLLDQAVSFSNGAINGSTISELLGIISLDLFFNVTEIILAKEKAKCLDLVHDVIFNGYDLNEFLIGLNDHLRNLLIVRATNSSKRLDVAETYLEKYEKVAQKFDETDLLRLIKIVSDTENNIKRSTNPQLMLELALIKMIDLDRTKDINTLLSEIAELSSGVPIVKPSARETGGTDNQAADLKKKKDNSVSLTYSSNTDSASFTSNDKIPPIVSDSAEKNVSITDIQAKWGVIIEEIKKSKIALGSFLHEGVPSRLEADTLILSFDVKNGFHIDIITKNHKIIETTLYKYFGMMFKIKCVKDENLSEEQHHAGKYAVADGLSQEVPYLDKIMEVFDAEIVR